jgi:nucleoside-diphosphate-sugar epimerase
MGRTILVTGASGALGPHLLAELLRCEENEQIFALLRPGPAWAGRVQDLRLALGELTGNGSCRSSGFFERLHPVAADICRDDLGLDSRDRNNLSTSVDVVIHAAANTRFSASLSDLRDVNVDGTRRVLALAHQCPRLQQFLLVSTTCVAGTRTGAIAERLHEEPGEFVNLYERTKWDAERLALAAALPVRIARLSTCIGGERTGYVHRFGAIHQSIRWLVRGLVPMLPAVDGSRVDLIATDVAARWIARAAARPAEGLEVCHIAAGDQAIAIRELIDAAVAHLRDRAAGWNCGQIEAPAIVDAVTFELFERSVGHSGDPLFARVLEGARSFFPSLLYPKVYQTAGAERLWGGPLPLSDWRSTLGKVIDFGCAHDWRGRRHARGHAHV